MQLAVECQITIFQIVIKSLPAALKQTYNESVIITY